MKQLELWERIIAFQIDDPSSAYKFSDKLAKEQNWSPEFAKRAITEYKKFMYLCSTSPTGASPSKIVDEVWHLHLTYTHNYWKEFCGSILNKEIHHYPSKGGNKQDQKHERWYNETLELYRNEFQEEPPGDIWPPPAPIKKSFSNLPVDPASLRSGNNYKNLLIFLLPLGILFFFNRDTPFNLTGKQFLIFYGTLLFSLAFYIFRNYRANLQSSDILINSYNLDSFNPFKLSRYIYNRKRSLDTAIVDLIERGILIAEPRGQFRVYPSNHIITVDQENPLITSITKQFTEGQYVKYDQLKHFYDDSRVYDEKLLELHKYLKTKNVLSWVVCSIIFAIGLIRVQQGIENKMPTNYLMIMLFFSVIIVIIVNLKITRRSLFKKAIRNNYLQENSQGPNLAYPAVNAFAILGFAALAYNPQFNKFKDTLRNSSDASGYGACGSSGGSCGSSGCGSGGCGGCGGGD